MPLQPGEFVRHSAIKLVGNGATPAYLYMSICFCFLAVSGEVKLNLDYQASNAKCAGQ